LLALLLLLLLWRRYSCFHFTMDRCKLNFIDHRPEHYLITEIAQKREASSSCL
jgi:hypothetical protein